jgi:hypothetical protein
MRHCEIHNQCARRRNIRIKKGEKCHSRTMMYSEPDKAFKMNEHQVSLRQSVEEIRLGKEFIPET